MLAIKSQFTSYFYKEKLKRLYFDLNFSVNMVLEVDTYATKFKVFITHLCDLTSTANPHGRHKEELVRNRKREKKLDPSEYLLSIYLNILCILKIW